MNTSLTILFLFSFFSISAQIKITGKVIDRQTKIELVGATIKYSNTTTTSNEKGEFTYAFSKDKRNEIIVSYTGYKQKKLNINNTQHIVVEMDLLIDSLDNVTVSSGVEKIIRKAIDRVKYNYPQEAFQQKGIVRMYFKLQEINPVAYKFYKIDAAINLYYTPYKKNTPIPQISLLENRIQKIESDVLPKDDVKWEYAYSDIQSADFVHNEASFIDKNEMKNFNYYLAGKIIYQGRTMYNIQFNSKKENELVGYIYVDTASHAFVYADYIRYNIHTLFRRGIKEQKNKVSYALIGEKWYLDQFEINNEFNHKYLNNSYKSFKSLSVNAANAIPQETNTIIESGAINVLELKKTVSDSTWLCYDSLFRENEKKGIFKVENLTEDSVLFKNGITPQKKTLFTSIDNYLKSNKFKFGFSISRLPASFAGIQNDINKKISALSGYTFDTYLFFRLYKYLSLEIGNSLNFGIGGIQATQTTLSLSSHFNRTNKLLIEPLVSFARVTINDKTTSQRTTINNILLGLRLSLRADKHLMPFIATSYCHPISINNSLIKVNELSFLPTIGIILKH